MADAPVPAPTPKQIVAEPPPAVIDDTAEKEAAAIAQQKLKRDNRMQGHIHNATVCLMWAFVFGLLLMGAVWLWHLLAPAKWAFLSDAQQHTLGTSLMAAIGSSFVTERAKKILG